MVKHWHTGDRFTGATGEDVAEGPAWLRSHMARFRRELAARPRKRAKSHRLMAALVARAFAMGPAGTLGAVAAVAVQAVRERCAARRVDAGMSVGQPAPGERLADDGAMAGVEVPVQAVDARVGQQHGGAAVGVLERRVCVKLKSRWATRTATIKGAHSMLRVGNAASSGGGAGASATGSPLSIERVPLATATPTARPPPAASPCSPTTHRPPYNLPLLTAAAIATAMRQYAPARPSRRAIWPGRASSLRTVDIRAATTRG